MESAACQIGFPCRAARPRLGKLRSFCQDFFFFSSPFWQPNTNCLLRDHRGAAYQMAAGRCCIRKKTKNRLLRQRTLETEDVLRRRCPLRRTPPSCSAVRYPFFFPFNVISLPILTPRRNHSLYSHSVDALIQQNYLVFALSSIFFFTDALFLMHERGNFLNCCCVTSQNDEKKKYRLNKRTHASCL